jgi:hypothetical protein
MVTGENGVMAAEERKLASVCRNGEMSSAAVASAGG